MAKSFYTTGTGNEQTLTPIINEKVPIYDTVADAEADLSNLEVGQIVKTKDAGLVANLNPIDEVKQGVFLPPTSNAVAKSLSYSTTEQKTGGVWIDGKPIYRKVLELNTPTSAGSGVKIGELQSSNVDKITKIDGILDVTGGQKSTLNMPGWTTTWLDSTYSIYMQIENVSIANMPIQVIIEYTKTTE